MDLPPELVGKIISYIPPSDKETHRNCSLVARSWTHPCRRHLFDSVEIWGETRLKLWLNAIYPTNVGVLQHIRSLSYRIIDAPNSLGGPAGSVDFLHDYSPSFNQLARLTLFSGCLPSPTQIGTPSAFQHTLSYLCLRGCIVATSTLVTLVNYFPNLSHLDLIALSHKADDQLTPPFSRPVQKISATEFHTDGALDLLDQLMGLRPRCDEATIGMRWSSCPSLAQRVVDGVEVTVKRLNLECDLAGVYYNVPKIPW